MSNTSFPPPFLDRIWPKLMPILAALGIPTAVLYYFLTKYPLFALGFFLLYEFGVFVMGLLGKVLGKLEDPLAEHMSSWLRQWVIINLSRYHRQYYQYLRYQHRDFDVKGLSTLGTYTLELNQVFVDLHINPSTPQSAIVNPVQIPQALLEGSHSIEDYLTSVPFRRQHLVIIGPPGSGKTTLLRHIVLTLVAPHRLLPWSRHGNVPDKMPILLFLRDHVQTLNEQQQYSLVNAIQDHLKKWEQPLPPEGWFQLQLRKGRCLIMMDGLDEVADPQTRQKVVSWVELQMASWNRNRFLVTSRPFGYRSNPLPNVAVLEVQPFTFYQVERFINQWYVANEIMSKQKDDFGVRMKAKEEAEGLLQRLRETPALLALVVNPLLLTMVATVHRYRGSLPGARILLYKEICEVFLGKRQEARGIKQELRADQRQLVLQPLAYHMMSQGIRDISGVEAELVVANVLRQVSIQMTPKVFLQSIENTSGLLLEREQGDYAFAHKTFQEYLAAVHIRENALEQVLIDQVTSSWWHEVIRLYCAQADATPIITACLAKTPPSVDAWTLAFECLDEARHVQADIKYTFNKAIEQGFEHVDPERRKLIAEVLLTYRLSHMRFLSEQVFIDTSLLTHAEYQLFLDDQQKQGRDYLPDHWTSPLFPSGAGHQPILGIRQSDALALCEWLTSREKGRWHYRLPRIDELEQDKEDADKAYWVCTDTDFVWMGNETSLNSVTQEQLDYSFRKDDERFFSYTFDLNDPSDATIYESIKLAKALRSTWERDLEINHALQSVLNRVQGSIQVLQKKLEEAEQDVFSIRDQLRHARGKVTSLRGELTSLRQEKLSLETNLAEEYRRREGSKQLISTLNSQLKKESRRLLPDNSRKFELQNKIKNAKEEMDKINNLITRYEDEESNVKKKIDVVEVKQNRYERGEEINSLESQLVNAQQSKNEYETKIAYFRTHVSKLERICLRVFPFSHAYNLKDAFSNALARNDVLDLDRFLCIVGESVFSRKLEEVSIQISDAAINYARELAQELTTYNLSLEDNSQSIIQDIRQETTQAQALASELSHAYTNHDIQIIVSKFISYLEYAFEDRSRLRSNSVLRRYIRYFARILASHLQHWWWENASSSPKQRLDDQQKRDIYKSVIDVYLDIYVAFSLLEERIKKENSAHEGILIVKEGKGEA